MRKKPTILCISGLDPSGGAGIQADIETIAQHQCYALPIISALTVQNSHNVLAVKPIEVNLIKQQIDTLLCDFSIDVIKIGLLADANLILYIKTLLQQLSEIPVIFDPIVKAGGGNILVKDQLRELYLDLLTDITIITPNSNEAFWLSNSTNIESSIDVLLEKNVDYVLLTGGHLEDKMVINRLYSQDQPRCLATNQWTRLTADYHGSGCTLASSLAANIALGKGILEASYKAQEYTWATLKNALTLGTGQQLPNRIYLTNQD